MTIDPGEMLFCEDTCQWGFDSTKVNGIEVNEDDKQESDGEKNVGCAGNPRGARAKRIELLQFGLSEVNNFVRHHDNSVRPNLIQILPAGHLHIFGLNSKNLVTE